MRVGGTARCLTPKAPAPPAIRCLRRARSLPTRPPCRGHCYGQKKQARDAPHVPPPPDHARNVATLLSCRRCRVEAATPLLLPLPRVRLGGWKVVSITSRESTPSWLAFSCRLPGGHSRASYCAASAAAAAATAVLPLPAARARLKSPLRALHLCLCHTGVRNVAAAATARSSGRARAGRVSDLSTASQLRRVWPRQ